MKAITRANLLLFPPLGLERRRDLRFFLPFSHQYGLGLLLGNRGRGSLSLSGSGSNCPLLFLFSSLVLVQIAQIERGGSFFPPAIFSGCIISETRKRCFFFFFVAAEAVSRRVGFLFLLFSSFFSFQMIDLLDSGPGSSRYM